MDDDSRKYFWLGALVVLMLALVFIALQASRMAADAAKRRPSPPAPSVSETNPAAARRRAYER